MNCGKEYTGWFAKKPDSKHWQTAAILGCLMFAFSSLSAATYTVSNLNNSGAGSLRQAMTNANSNVGPDTIKFTVSGTISPTSQLPSLTDNRTIIDAYDRWSGTWPDGSPGDTINGSSAGYSSHGIVINGADYCEIRGLYIRSFRGGRGIMLDGSAQYNTIGGTGPGMRNVIVDNATEGIMLYSSDCRYNKIIGNYVGVRADGTTADSNDEGVEIFGWYNTLGGSTAAERNIISGNTPRRGIEIERYAAYNVVKGNYIGTDKTGTIAVPNTIGIGIMRDEVAQPNYNIIGGTSPGDRNIISGNTGAGISIPDVNPDYGYWSSSNGNVVIGNWIGLNVNGNALPQDTGIAITAGVSDTIGGLSAGARNVISGNTLYGIYISGYSADNHIIQGNYIGSDPTGTAPRPNGTGIFIGGSADANLVGGTSPAARNIISGNTNYGINITGSGTNYNTVKNNYIGTDVTGAANLGNGSSGIRIANGTQNDTIGVAGQGNIIAYNGAGSTGIALVSDNSTRQIRISGNSFFNNSGLAIDLNNNGVTLNDDIYNNTGTTIGNRGIDFPNVDTVFATDNTYSVLHVAGYVGTTRAIAQSNATFANCRVEIYKAQLDPTGYGEGMLYLGYLTTGGSNSIFSGYLNIAGLGVSAGDYITGITIDGSSNTSEFGRDTTIGYPTSIVVSSFSAEVEAERVLINWQTGSEANVAGFNLYRSLTETSDYAKLTGQLIPAKGDPIGGANYDFNDPAGREGYYYKLEVVDLSGGSTFYGPVQATAASVEETPQGPNPVPFAVIPNPVRSAATIQYHVPSTRTVTLKIFDSNGRQVAQLVNGTHNPGNYFSRWDTERVGTGVYFIALAVSGEKTKMEKAIIIK